MFALQKKSTQTGNKITSGALVPELGWLDAAKKVLGDSEEGTVTGLHYTEIAERIDQGGLRTNLGATPHISVNAVISASLRKQGEQSPFERVSEGIYKLRSTEDNSQPPVSAAVRTDKLQTTTDEQEQEQQQAISEEEEKTQHLIDQGLITAMGMYWGRDTIKNSSKILGKKTLNSAVIDFTGRNGLYLLHDGHRIVYVGRSAKTTLGARILAHTKDRLAPRWNRFSWFATAEKTKLGDSEEGDRSVSVASAIATIEAILIEAIEAPLNRRSEMKLNEIEYIPGETT